MTIRGASLVLWLVLISAATCTQSAPRVLHSYAIVNDDATLTVARRRVHLQGVHIPETERFCRSWMRPVRCASRAVLALEFKIQGFVYCVESSRNADGSLNARCFVNRGHFDEGEDLGAYLIEQGWAVATPDAPFEYRTLERIARHHDRGIWGRSVDGR